MEQKPKKGILVNQSKRISWGPNSYKYFDKSEKSGDVRF